MRRGKKIIIKKKKMVLLKISWRATNAVSGLEQSEQTFLLCPSSFRLSEFLYKLSRREKEYCPAFSESVSKTKSSTKKKKIIIKIFVKVLLYSFPLVLK